MLVLVWLVQFSVIVLFIFFVSGRLIGPKVSLTKRVLSVGVSVIFTSFVFWYTYLRGKNLAQITAHELLHVSSLLWIGSMLLISMLLYLFFELFDPIELNENGNRKQDESIFKRYKTYWRNQKRFRQVLSIAMKNGVTQTFKYARYRDNERELAVALRKTLEQSGGIFIKFGQVLSTRNDLLPQPFIDELELLQQNVPPMLDHQVEQILQRNYGDKFSEIFSYFDRNAIASASIGQVHTAILKETNERVVVKLLRPEMSVIMEQDMSILIEFANWISERSKWAETIGFKDLAIGFAHALREEIDFTIEARNMLQIQHVMNRSLQRVKIPNVYKHYSSRSILVMEYINGESIQQSEKLLEMYDLDRKQLAESLLFTFLEQALVSGIFHADPHPGNIYIEKYTKQIALLDFGAVGRLGTHQQEGLKLFLFGIYQNNPELVTDGVIYLVENENEVARDFLEQKINDSLLRITYLAEIEIAQLVYAIFNVVSECGLKFHPSVSVAMRALITLDGTLRTVDPQFNLFQEAKNFSHDYIKSSLIQPFKDPARTRAKLEEELALFIPTLQRIPRRIDQLVKKVEGGKVTLHHDLFGDKKSSNFIMQLFSRFILLLVGITFGVISVALLAISQLMHSAFAIYLNTAAYLGLFLCAVLLVRLSIQAIREMKRTE